MSQILLVIKILLILFARLKAIDFLLCSAHSSQLFSSTRKTLLKSLENAGFGIDDLIEIQKIIDAEKSDIFDVLEFVAFAKKPITRAERIEKSEEVMEKEFSSDQLDFINFVLGQYKEEGVIVLDDEKLPTLLELKYKSIQNAKQILGDLNDARNIFLDFQKTLYKV